MTTFLLILFILSTLGFIYVTYITMLKLEAAEDYIVERESELSETIEIMEEIDASGAFEAEDEVGVVFRQLKEMVTELRKTYDQ